MAHSHILLGAGATPAQLSIRRIGFADLKDALAKGVADFMAMPTHAMFLCAIYPIIGLLLARLAFGYSILPLLYPLASSFALIGPLAALGLYELSRRREAGLDGLGDAMPSTCCGRRRSGRLPRWAFCCCWLSAFGLRSRTRSMWRISAMRRLHRFASFVHEVLTTRPGWNLIIVGNAVGFCFAVVVLTISVVSFPLLLDRDVGAAVALLTSIRAVVENPLTMATWGLIVAVLLALGSLPFFLGLTVVLPVLGHATWHLYRKVVEPETSPRPDFRKEPPRRSRSISPPIFFPGPTSDCGRGVCRAPSAGFAQFLSRKETPTSVTWRVSCAHLSLCSSPASSR